jgi:hypothetical protein
VKTLDLYTTILGNLPPALNLPSHNTAMVIMPGGQDWRLSQAPWQHYTDTVLVTGTDNDPAYSFTEVQALLERSSGKTPATIRHQDYARHTPDQANWTVTELLRLPHIRNLIVSTAAYHLPRVVLTVVKSWLQHGDSRRLRIYSLPTLDPDPRNGFAHADAERSATTEQELARIEQYQHTGDVATADEFFACITT